MKANGLDERRRFGLAERQALYLAAGGVCSSCGAELEKSWEADHVIAYSRGGPTDVTNGQALCPTCNRRKGGGTMTHGDSGSSPHARWQAEARNRFLVKKGRDFLVVACPGAGKTQFSLDVASMLLERRAVGRIVVVVPTEHLKKQWQDAAAENGIELEKDWSGDRREAKDFAGLITTYQQVAMCPLVFRTHCGAAPTIVIFDEIHHAADGRAWGDALRHAFEPAAERLSLSGTPFRQDNNPIPFVRYEDNRSVADFSYGYASAVADSVCRHVFFPSWEGTMRWSASGLEHARTFAEDVDDEAASRRLRAALDARNGEWVAQVSADAARRLEALRANGHPAAGGLILAMDTAHAKQLAEVISRHSGEPATVVIHEDPDASKKIESFKSGAAKWIVAVRMVSEGVDIPRLRVLVYATNTTTEMFFRQAMGRIARVIRDLEEQAAYFYIPADRRLLALAQAVKEEIRHELGAREDRPERPQLDLGERVVSSFVVLGSSASPHDVIFDGGAISQGDIARAREAATASGIPASVPIEYIARILRWRDGVAPTLPVPSAQPQPPLEERKRERRAALNKLVVRYAYQIEEEIPHVHMRLANGDGVRLANCTLDQIETRIVTVQRWLNGEGSHVR